MKRVTCLLICLIMCWIIPATADVSAEKALPRGKSLGIIKTEWIDRYNAIPTKIVGQKTEVFLMLLTEEDCRKYYFANPLDNVDFTVMCEDNTDEVVAVFIQIHLKELSDSYDLGNTVGRFISESVYRMALATDQNTTIQSIADTVFPALDVNAIQANQDFNNSVNLNGFIYVFTLSEDGLMYGVKNSTVFESEEEFQTYRNSK